MTRHDDTVRLRHMLDAAREAVDFSKGRSRKDLENDRLYHLAMVRLVEVIGEAAARVSEATRQAHPHVPWSEVVGARNRLIHGYDQVDLDILWDILALDLPPLVQQLDRILGGGPSPSSP
jgi:uncharacterized protein with HEPN domain